MEDTVPIRYNNPLSALFVNDQTPTGNIPQHQNRDEKLGVYFLQFISLQHELGHVKRIQRMLISMRPKNIA